MPPLARRENRPLLQTYAPNLLLRLHQMARCPKSQTDVRPVLPAVRETLCVYPETIRRKRSLTTTKDCPVLKKFSHGCSVFYVLPWNFHMPKILLAVHQSLIFVIFMFYLPIKDISRMILGFSRYGNFFTLYSNWVLLLVQ